MQKCVRAERSFARWGSFVLELTTHGYRGGLHSSAASRLGTDYSETEKEM
jgi:hypothetical protein